MPRPSRIAALAGVVALASLAACGGESAPAHEACNGEVSVRFDTDRSPVDAAFVAEPGHAVPVPDRGVRVRVGDVPIPPDSRFRGSVAVGLMIPTGGAELTEGTYTSHDHGVTLTVTRPDVDDPNLTLSQEFGGADPGASSTVTVEVTEVTEAHLCLTVAASGHIGEDVVGPTWRSVEVEAAIGVPVHD